ncbi:MAG: hypothetical protein QG657_3888 [Acidobacteriota bacterium]|nr:hypothetical protein [Acidobacteriota bacterium]
MSKKYIFITPIENLKLEVSKYKTIKIGNVHFVSYDKIDAYKKRFGISKSITKMPLIKQTDNDFFECAPAFAIIHHNGESKDTQYKYILEVQRAIDILCMAQKGYTKRQSTSIPAISGMPTSKSYKYMFVDKHNPNSLPGWRLASNPDGLIVNERMVEFHKKAYFFKLLKIINKDISTSKEWHNSIINAAIFAGKSWAAKSIYDAFLFNMIALETLLTESGDKFSDVLPLRIKSFIGWMGNWDKYDYKKRIDDIYKKRCKLVHEGNINNISVDDLLFSDDLIFGVFDNIVNHVKIFHEKKDIILFSKKVEAEHLLGIKGRTRPRTLRFFETQYNTKDKIEII